MTVSGDKRLARGTYIGGQQIAAIVGMHPYMGAGNVYAHAVYGDTEDISDVGVVRRGLICEPGLLEWIRNRLGVPRERWMEDVFTIDPDVPFFAGTQDAVEIDDAGNVVHVHEVTTTSSRMADRWGSDGDPTGAMKYKWIQNQYYQGLTGCTQGTVWLFIADTGEIRSYPVIHSAEALESLRNEGERFWLDHVLAKVPPDPSVLAGIAGWASVAGSIDAIYNDSKDAARDPSEEMVNAANNYVEARDAIKEAEGMKQEAAAMLKAQLGEYEKSSWSGGSVTWKRNKPGKSTDYEAAYKSLTAIGLAQGWSMKESEKHKEQHTHEKKGPRILRVNVRKKDEGK